MINRYVLMAPFSIYSSRNWPAYKWRDLSNLLYARGIGTVAVGTADQKQDLEATFQTTYATWHYGLAPNKIVEHMLGAIVVIGNDSGIPHLGGLLEIPTISIHAGCLSHEFLFGMAPSIVSVTADIPSHRSDHNPALLQSISVDKVFAALEQIIGSQHGEDHWIVNNLKIPKDGTFVEVGAADGLKHSNTLRFERMGWRGLLIEPDPRSFQQLQKNRPLAKCLPFAIGTNEGKQSFTQHKDPTLSGLDQPQGERIDVEVKRLDTLLGGKHVDLLSIDTEGTEVDVWASVGNLRPSIVIAEWNTVGRESRKSELISALLPCGYKVVHQTEGNLIFQCI